MSIFKRTVFKKSFKTSRQNSLIEASHQIALKIVEAKEIPIITTKDYYSYAKEIPYKFLKNIIAEPIIGSTLLIISPSVQYLINKLHASGYGGGVAVDNETPDNLRSMVKEIRNDYERYQLKAFKAWKAPSTIHNDSEPEQIVESSSKKVHFEWLLKEDFWKRDRMNLHLYLL